MTIIQKRKKESELYTQSNMKSKTSTNESKFSFAKYESYTIHILCIKIGTNLKFLKYM